MMYRRVGSARRRWVVTRTTQWLPTSMFDDQAVTVISRALNPQRLYAIDRSRDGLVLAASAFDLQGGPEGTVMINELALARCPSGHLDGDAVQAAIVLLERLHDVAHRHNDTGNIWAQRVRGASLDEILRIGFEARGLTGGPDFFRPDTAAADHRLRALLGRIRRAWPT